MSEPEPLLIKSSDMQGFEHTPGGSVRFAYGDEHGLGAISVAMSDNPPGAGEGFVHRHPCSEAFVVYEGRGIYTVGDKVVVAEPGDVVFVPPNTWHSFRPDGGSRLRHVGVFDSSHVDTELQSTT
jgi:mannose-6-phosphate isomerase-like protein (cupin superfamily)